MCWTLDCFDSDFEEMSWRYSYGEFRGRLRRKIGEYTTSHLQAAHGMIKVVSMAFGGDGKGKQAKPNERIITDIDEFNRIMAGG